MDECEEEDPYDFIELKLFKYYRLVQHGLQLNVLTYIPFPLYAMIWYDVVFTYIYSLSKLNGDYIELCEITAAISIVCMCVSAFQKDFSKKRGRIIHKLINL